MENFIVALKDTPIPTTLVLIGIVFLYLSIAGQSAGSIAVSPGQQGLAMGIGIVLLISGVTLHVMLGEQPPPQSPPSTSEPREKKTETTPPIGIIEFIKWAGGDCWEVYRGDARAADGCGSHKIALQTGIYTVKSITGAFEPFTITIQDGVTTTVPPPTPPVNPVHQCCEPSGRVCPSPLPLGYYCFCDATGIAGPGIVCR